MKGLYYSGITQLFEPFLKYMPIITWLSIIKCWLSGSLDPPSILLKAENLEISGLQRMCYCII